jgi:hypothetical protein
VIGYAEANGTLSLDVFFVVGMGQATIQTLGYLARRVDLGDYAARIVHPLLRAVGPPPADARPPAPPPPAELRAVALEALAALVVRMGPDFLPFIPIVNKARVHAYQRPTHASSEECVWMGV